MTWEMAQVDADPAALLATAAAQPHDPGFVPFVRRAQSAGVLIEVVSDGFGFFIRPALEALGVGELPVVSARTTFADRGASIAFPNGHPHCHVCGTCKRNRVLEHQAAGRAVVFIGDGESDRYAAGYADVVFAKHSLINICLEAGWAFKRWTEFAEIDRWLDERLRAWSVGRGVVARAGGPPDLLRPRGLGQGSRRSARRVLAARSGRDPAGDLMDTWRPRVRSFDERSLGWRRRQGHPFHRAGPPGGRVGRVRAKPGLASTGDARGSSLATGACVAHPGGIPVDRHEHRPGASSASAGEMVDIGGRSLYCRASASRPRVSRRSCSRTAWGLQDRPGPRSRGRSPERSGRAPTTVPGWARAIVPTPSRARCRISPTTLRCSSTVRGSRRHTCSSATVSVRGSRRCSPSRIRMLWSDRSSWTRAARA